MNRAQWALTALLGVQLLLLLGTSSLFSGGSAGSGPHALLPELGSLIASRIQISGPEEESVTLERTGDGWALRDAGGYPVEPGKVEKLLDDLGQLKVRNPVVSSDRYHAALKVTDKDHERRLEIWPDGGGDPEVDLYLGSSPNYRVNHVRLGGDDRVYEARGLNTWDLRAEPGSWVDKKFVDIPFDDVEKIRLGNAHGEFELRRQDGEWTLVSPPPAAGRKLDSSKADSLVRSLASLWLSEPVGPADPEAHGFGDPAATVEITYRTRAETAEPALTEEQEVDAGDPAATGEEPDSSVVTDAPEAPAGGIEVVTLWLGSEVEDGDGKRYASRSGFDYSVTLSKYDAEKATGKKLDDLYEDQDADEDGD